jgi:hypothetical protein
VGGVADLLSYQQGEAARVASGDGHLRESQEWSICCTRWRPEDTVRCARVWRRYWYKRRVAEAPEVVGIDVLLRRTRAPPASNFASLAAFWAEERKGGGGGRRGVFIAVARRRLKQAMKGI